ncbi:hypothetical protein [Haloferula sp. BvORR071]|uniref:hypothetical protein n=1 Tax=Haloferula sp. BvORR071 TaxID=1396141 RepID=UPI0005589D4D|nr:hypothetical protein [Haloferula sp. BvORR071]
MKSREIITLVLGLAAVVGLVFVVKFKGSPQSGTASPEITSAATSEEKDARQSWHASAPKLMQNGPAKINRTLNQYTQKRGLNLMHDEDLPLVLRGSSTISNSMLTSMPHQTMTMPNGYRSPSTTTI